MLEGVGRAVSAVSAVTLKSSFLLRVEVAREGVGIDRSDRRVLTRCPGGRGRGEDPRRVVTTARDLPVSAILTQWGYL